MTLKVRKLRKYNPRRSSKELKEQRQHLKNLELTIAEDMKELFFFLKKGSEQEILSVTEKTKHDLKALGPNMEHIAMSIGNPFPKMVRSFLHNLDNILHFPDTSPSSWQLWADEQKITSCYRATEQLERALSK